jgi:uncharacterized protein YndB with AHSA1/START domain
LGPNGHTLVSYDVDFRDGGRARLRVHSPDGLEFCVDDVHLEIAEPERLVFTGTLQSIGERSFELLGFGYVPARGR